MHVWDMDQESALHTIETNFVGTVAQLVWSPDETALAIGYGREEGHIAILSLDDGSIINLSFENLKTPRLEAWLNN